MSEESAWIKSATAQAREASPPVPDAVADLLEDLLAGTLQERRLSNKQLQTAANTLLAAMDPAESSEGTT